MIISKVGFHLHNLVLDVYEDEKDDDKDDVKDDDKDGRKERSALQSSTLTCASSSQVDPSWKVAVCISSGDTNADVDDRGEAANDDDNFEAAFCLKISRVRRRRSAHWSGIYGGNDVTSCAFIPPCHQQCPFLSGHQVSALFLSSLQQQVKSHHFNLLF